MYAAFLQNAPVVRHTRGFTPGWYAVPRWGTPNASPSPSLPAQDRTRKRQRDRAGASIGSDQASPSRTARKHILPRAFLRARALSRETSTHDSPQAPAQPPNHPAAAGPGRSEHRNVDILIPLARQRESPTGPNVPCERRTDPAEPPRAPGPPRSPAAPHRFRPSIPSLPTTSLRLQIDRVSIRTSTCIVRSVRPL